MSALSCSEALRDAVMNPTDAIVGLVDNVLRLCRQHALHIDWRENRCRVTSPDRDKEDELELPLRKSVFRAILARVATLCDEQSPGTFAPYGGSGELSFGSDPKTILRVAWVNTTGEQCLTIMPCDASSRPSTATARQPVDATPMAEESLRQA